MESSGGNPVAAVAGDSSRRYGVPFSASNFIQSPISALLDYSGILRPRSSHQENEALIPAAPTDNGEVSIRIIGAGDHEHVANSGENGGTTNESRVSGNERDGDGEVTSLPSTSGSASASPMAGNGNPQNSEGEAASGNRDSSYQRYDIQQVARWIEQILPFSLLLLVVFIRQHLQGPPRSSGIQGDCLGRMGTQAMRGHQTSPCLDDVHH